MATSKTILIGVAIAGMIGAVIFFAFLVKRPVSESESGGLPTPSPLSFPNQPPASPGAEALPPQQGGAGAEAGVPTNAFIPIKQAPAQVSANAFSPLSSFEQRSPLVLSGTEESSLSGLVSQLNLRDESGNLLSPQQLLASQSNLPLPIQKLLQKPGGPTITDIMTMEENFRAQADTLNNKMNQLQNLSQSGDAASVTELCNEIITDAKIFDSAWGSTAVPSALQQVSNCGGGVGGQLPLQLPFGLPDL